MNRSLVILVCFLFSLRAHACWQTGQDPVVIRAESLNGRATVDGRPEKGIRFELHKAITFNREEGTKKGLWEPKVFGTATSDASGLFTFGEIPPGRYWLVVPRGSLNFAVEVVDSYGKPPYKRLWYNYFADSCEELHVEDAR